MRDIQYVNSTETTTSTHFEHNNLSKQSFIKSTVHLKVLRK